MSVTQKQIADYLGVSQSLVTQALRGVPGISEKSRQRVEDAARELGYGATTNSAARSLRARRGGSRVRTHIIAVVMGEFFDGMPVHEIPFYQPIMRGLKAEAEARELDLSFSSPNVNRIPRLFTDGGVDGIISLYADPLGGMRRDSPLPCPVLRVGDGEPTEWTLRPDDRTGIYQATRHLIDQGHKRIAYLGDLNGGLAPDVMYKQRLDGYLCALGDAGIKVRNQLIESHIGGPEYQLGAAGMARLLQRAQDFTAVVCFNDTSAMGAIAELQRQGLSVPGDVSVTGFDDVWAAYRHEPALTTVFFDRLAMGRRAIELIDEAAGHPDPGARPAGHELLPVTFIDRASTAAPNVAKS